METATLEKKRKARKCRFGVNKITKRCLKHPRK